jgi:hypothetical protein
MLKKTLLAVTSVAMLALSAPISHAAPAALVRSGCGFEFAALPTAMGGQDTYTSVVYGFGVFDDQLTHTLHCFVTVNGVDQGGVSISGSVFVAGAANVTFHADDDATVELCTEIDGILVSCGSTDETQIPPQEVIDLIDQVFDLLDQAATLVDDILAPVYAFLQGFGGDSDPIVCPILASFSPGIPGVVDINVEGDVTLAVAGPFWDCPPYGDLFPPA